jgi:hypothetical protein
MKPLDDLYTPEPGWRVHRSIDGMTFSVRCPQGHVTRVELRDVDRVLAGRRMPLRCAMCEATRVVDEEGMRGVFE